MGSIHDATLDRHEISAALLQYQWRRFVEHAAKHGFLTSASKVLRNMEIDLCEQHDLQQERLVQAERAKMDDDAQRWFDANGPYFVD